MRKRLFKRKTRKQVKGRQIDGSVSGTWCKKQAKTDVNIWGGAADSTGERLVRVEGGLKGCSDEERVQ